MTAVATYSLLELNQYIRRVISLNFDQPLWIEAEIGQASFSRGHWYIDLIQKEGEAVVAQCQAALWANVLAFLKRKSPVPPDEILKQGMAVKLKVNVDYHERYGLKLIIEDIDSNFTIGVLELQRQAILKVIQEHQLVRKNASAYLPPVIQRLAVISSSRAAGWKDFIKHIEDNLYGYHIEVTLYEAAMQGQQVEAEMLSCLADIEYASDTYDAVAIIRGGGSRMDLAAFDNLPLASKIAHYPIPVLIGIGHEIDQSVLDLVAYASLKTPTAVADYVVEHNAVFEQELNELAIRLKDEIDFRLREEKDRLTQLANNLVIASRSRITIEQQRLKQNKQFLQHAIGKHVQLAASHLSHLEILLQAIHPDQVLARGYTITSHNGKTLTSREAVTQGMEIQTTFRDGSVKSKVE